MDCSRGMERSCRKELRPMAIPSSRRAVVLVFRAAKGSVWLVTGGRPMARGVVARRMRQLSVAGLVGLVLGGLAPSASAHRTTLSVEVLPDQASIAPDGRSMFFNITTVCDRKWTVVEARVTAVQPQGSGEGSFTPTCGRIPYVVGVTVPVLNGTFKTGEAQVSARLVVAQGKTKQAQDSAVLRVRPSVSVQLADQAVLESSGQAARIKVTVTCPMTSNPQGGQVTIYQNGASTAFFGPTPCDGVPHTVSVRVVRSSGTFQVGSAEADAFASVEEGGDSFPGSDIRTIQIVTSA
jgi:hypothetical protein